MSPAPLPLQHANPRSRNANAKSGNCHGWQVNRATKRDALAGFVHAIAAEDWRKRPMGLRLQPTILYGNSPDVFQALCSPEPEQTGHLTNNQLQATMPEPEGNVMHVRPSENPRLRKNGPSLQVLRRYWDRFDEILRNADKPVEIDALISRFDVGASTVKKHLKAFIRQHPDLLVHIIGFYPDADTILDLAEQRLGEPVTAANLLAINKASKEIVDAITKPRHERFLREKLAPYLNDEDSLQAPASELIDLLYEEYTDFVHEADNALVSIAGRLNEEILLRGLESGGLKRNRDFVRTGNNSEADIHIHYQDGAHRKTLYCEVKSYHARERFLRGLRDIPHREKIGVGFFRDPTEFNPGRTKTILEAQPLAIYLPDDTFAALEAESRKSVTTEQNRLYRPLSRFVDDAVFFHREGRLPVFNGQ